MKPRKSNSKTPNVHGIIARNYKVKNWNNVNSVCFVDVKAYILNEKVLEDCTVLLFLERTPKDYVSLPMRFFVTKKYTATIDAQYTLKKVRLIWSNILEGDKSKPPDLKIKVIAIPKSVLEVYAHVELRSFPAVAEAFTIKY